MDVRPALDKDASRIAELFVQLGYGAVCSELEKRLPHLLRHLDTEVFVACRQDVVQAVLVMNVLHPLHVAQPWAVISALVVEQTMHTQGAGAALIDAAEQAALKRGCSHVELSCSEQRSGAHAFYEAMGFGEVRKRFVKKLAAADPGTVSEVD